MITSRWVCAASKTKHILLLPVALHPLLPTCRPCPHPGVRRFHDARKALQQAEGGRPALRGQQEGGDHAGSDEAAVGGRG